MKAAWMKAASAALGCAIAMGAAQASVVTLPTSALDSTTGLQWLDISQTVGMSYDQVLASTYVTQDGYKVATAAQLTAFLSDAGTVPNATCCAFNSTYASTVGLMQALGGNTSYLVGFGAKGDPVGWITGMYGNQGGIALIDTQLGVGANGTVDLAWANGTSPSSSYRADVGAFLVRPQQTVPEPMSLGLVGIAMAGLGLALRKRAR